MSNNRTIAEYLELIPPPSSLAPKFMAWMRVAMKISNDTQNVLNEIIEAFDIDTAVGNQLDVLGDLLNRPREVDFTPGGGASPILPDSMYRVVLKAQILKNIWKGTKGEIYDFWEKFFPDNPVLITDNQDMTMTVTVVNVPTTLEGTVTFSYDTDTDEEKGYDEGYWEGFQNIGIDLIENGYYTPKPAGVGVIYEFITDPVFAYDADSEFFKGYDESAEWIAP